MDTKYLRELAEEGAALHSESQPEREVCDGVLWALAEIERLRGALLLMRGRLLAENPHAVTTEADALLLGPNVELTGQGGATMAISEQMPTADDGPVERMVRHAAPKPGKRLTAKQKRMQRAIRLLSDYIATYEAQAECLNYTDKTLIDDVLYALGVALEPDAHKWASGFDVWKDKLREHLAADLHA